MDAIAEEAGVSKMTLYARWGSKDELCIDVLKALRPPQEIPSSGNPRKDLIAMLRALIDLQNAGPPRDILPRVVGEMADNEDFAAVFRDRVIAPRREAVRRKVEEAVSGGQLVTDTDVDVAADMLLGPIYYRRLVRGQAAPKRFAERLVTALYRAFGTNCM
jgi:AcrR family transcriptional regulator